VAVKARSIYPPQLVWALAWIAGRIEIVAERAGAAELHRRIKRHASAGEFVARVPGSISSSQNTVAFAQDGPCLCKQGLGTRV